ncbi:ribbon-helix-helix protein, CopG family [Mesorhizobium sp. M5C.F.Cr.IN.023.01.1.1]|uniref:ribbon-helix-helix domain-containing protein n=1 Tax=Mesorhizobium sp. M5C.F.Cr.IN.023.01.1.1 TaxID=2496768 RepID=UPI000FC9CB56|nr:ribbon-helix-helix domain-containing protein [Mesorhizobium sp. M5C.F.Cr.IN.023.01.1.1]RUV67800.1 ribbon-helix-helix protein, CopG family [Mesorhizobium sp. M5C.F.Cr.IN.023.01.1.1]
MNRTKPADSTKRVSALRERRRAAGVSTLATPLPVELIAEIDRIKEERGAASRAPIIEEAVRLLIEKQQRA